MTQHMSNWMLRKLIEITEDSHSQMVSHVRHAQSMVIRYKGEIDTEAARFRRAIQYTDETLLCLRGIRKDRGDEE